MGRKRLLLGLTLVVMTALSRLSPAEPSQAELQGWFDQIEATAPVTKTALDAAERKALLDEVSEHRVASLAQLTKYDPPPGETGFCFGRAMASHLLARKRGLANESIHKLFVVGDMGVWRFHVTTLVKGKEDGQLYAIDPVMRDLGHADPMTPEAWIAIVHKEWDPSKKCKLYLTDPFTTIADMRVVHGKDFETGEYLFEIKFDPAGKPGLEPFTFGGTEQQTVYRVSLDAQLRYFLRTRDSSLENRFDFLKLEMKVLKGPQTVVRKFDFRSYFVDLLDDLRQPARPVVAGGVPHDGLVPALDGAPVPPADASEPAALFGFKGDFLN